VKLLAIRLSALGDVIHTIPAVAALKAAGEVAWVVEAPYAELVEIVAEVRVIPVRLKRWSAREIRAARRAVRGFDAAIDFQGNIKSALVARASAAPERYGFDRSAVRERPAALFYNHHVHVDRSQHVVEWNLELAEALLLESLAPRKRGEGGRRPGEGPSEEPLIRPSGTFSPRGGEKGTIDTNWAAFPADPQNRLARFRGRVVLLPGAGRPNKRWPVDGFREITRHFETLVVWGPGEEELADAIGGEVAPETNLRELAFLLQNARVVVGGDTGPLHLAAALGVPVIGLYGPTDPRRNGPYGQTASTINYYPTTRSMESIGAGEVIEKVEEVLG
jgi:heptosyltransferase-1